MPPPKTPKELYERIEGYYSFEFSKNITTFEQAKTAYEELNKLTSTNGDAYYYLGLLTLYRKAYSTKKGEFIPKWEAKPQAAQKAALAYFAQVPAGSTYYNEAQAKFKQLKFALKSPKAQERQLRQDTHPAQFYLIAKDRMTNIELRLFAFNSLKKQAEIKSDAHYFLGLIEAEGQHAGKKKKVLSALDFEQADVSTASKKKFLRRALKEFNKVNRHAEYYGEARLAAANSYNQLGNPIEAVIALNQAIAAFNKDLKNPKYNRNTNITIPHKSDRNYRIETDETFKEKNHASITSSLTVAKQSLEELYQALASRAKNKAAFKLLKRYSNAGDLLAKTNLADMLFFRKDYAAAARQYTTVITRITAQSKKDQKLLTRVNKSLDNLFQKLAQIAKGEEKGKKKKARSVLQNYSKKGRLTAKAALGGVYFHKGDYIKAEKEYAAIRDTLLKKKEELTDGEKALLKAADEKLDSIYDKLAEQVKNKQSRKAYNVINDARTLGAGKALASLLTAGFTIKKRHRGKETHAAESETSRPKATAIKSWHSKYKEKIKYKLASLQDKINMLAAKAQELTDNPDKFTLMSEEDISTKIKEINKEIEALQKELQAYSEEASTPIPLGRHPNTLVAGFQKKHEAEHKARKAETPSSSSPSPSPSKGESE